MLGETVKLKHVTLEKYHVDIMELYGELASIIRAVVLQAFTSFLRTVLFFRLKATVKLRPMVP